MPLLRLTLILTVCLALAACRDDDSSAAPPNATLSTPDGATRVRAGIGSFCWEDGCTDRSGVVTNATAAQLGRGAPYGIEFDAGHPDETEIAWLVVEEPPGSTAGDELVWDDLEVDLERVEPGWAAVMDPGMYVYVLRATWEGQGEVTYGFYLDRRAN